MAAKKKQKKSLYARQAELNPKAHKLSIAISMTGISCDTHAADIILQVIDGMDKMGVKFDLETACKIRANTEAKYQKLIQ